MEIRGNHERGIRYLNAAKKVASVARFLDQQEAELVRRTADRLTEIGLEKIVRGARDIAALLARQTQAPSNDQG